MALEVAQSINSQPAAQPRKKRGRKVVLGTATPAVPRPPKPKPTPADILLNIQLANALAAAPDALDMDLPTTCVFWGGSRPIDASTLYRGIKAGRFPPAEKTSPNIRRWNLGKCRAAKARNAEV
jgi:predicted DNA-binding transcriptional regulator AlpA